MPAGHTSVTNIKCLLLWAGFKAFIFIAVLKQPLWLFWVAVILGIFAGLIIQSVDILIDYFHGDIDIRLKRVKGLHYPVITICRLNSFRKRVSAPTRTHRERPTLLPEDIWLDVAQHLDYYDNTLMRFASGKLNRLIHRKSSTLPLRVIAATVVTFSDSLKVYTADAFGADLRTGWRDLIFDFHQSPESMLFEVLSKSRGLVFESLELRGLPYNEQVMNVMAQCLPFVAVSKLSLVGIASGHDQVHRLLEIVPGLRHVWFKNDAGHRNAAAVLGACAARKIPEATLQFAADVGETKILDFVFNDNSPKIARNFGIISLRRSLSHNFFELIVERCRRNHQCKSLSFGLSGLLTDPTDVKYTRYVVECNASATMYRFRKAGQADLPFTILVGMSTTTKRFYLKVFQGDANELCGSLDEPRQIPPCKM